MVTEVINRTYTLEEFLALDLPEDEGLYELIRGEIVPKRKQQQPGPSKEHAKIIAKIALYLGNYLLDKPIGSLFAGAACIIPTVDYLIPDVSFYADGRIPTDPSSTLPYPDLAIEVVSKSDIWFKVREKVEDYLNAGTSEVWVFFWPDKEIHVYQKDNKKTLTVNDQLEIGILPDFKLAVSKLFE